VELVVTGFHLTTRVTIDPSSGTAFGGPIAHGHQPSGFYEAKGHPDNIFWHQTLLANRLFQELDAVQRRQALINY
jgi:hypothetical protein